jgi:Rps23 Pro-64 3,4-dihydroxylase Tpa1-like proline 4-hydroxylase
MNEELLKNNFIYIPEFICPDRAISVGEKFKKDCEIENLPGDGQAWNSSSCYNYTPALEILCEKTPEVSNIIGQTVLPTYTYGRIYKNGSVLEKHTDRPSCEISATINLGGDSPWSIWIETPDKKNRCVSLNPGDAMIYLGCVAPHWRDEFYGTWYAQFFLHYVRSCGPCAPCYFDKHKLEDDDSRIKQILLSESKGEITIVDDPNDKLIVLNDDDHDSIISAKEEYEKYKKSIEFKTRTKEEKMIIRNDSKIGEDKLESLIKSISEKKNKKQESPFIRFENDSKESSILEKIKNSDSKIKGSISLSDFIVVFDNIVPENLCDAIIDEYSNSDYWNHAETGGGHDPDARRCDVISISERQIIEQNRDHRLELDNGLFECVSNALQQYQNRFPDSELEIQEDSGYELLRYKSGDFYVQHTDHFKQQPRTLSCTICLNDDYSGGEFAFFNRELVYKIKKGSVLMFPSNFMYPHEVMPVTSGTRYSIITWLI